MSYFNHAFCKSFLVTELPIRGSVYSQDLTAGQLALFPGDWEANLEKDPSGLPPVPKNLVYLAQGSFINADKVGTHGGYKESVKTKGINPRYVTRLWSSSCQNATAATATIEVDSDCAPCGENLFLRLDVKGSPALRFLNHNAYAIGDSSGSAANTFDLPGICCADGQEFLDPAVALAKAAQMLLEDPIITPFVQEQQWGGALAGITVTTTAGLNGLASIAGAGPVGTGFAVGDYVSLTDAGTGIGAIAQVTAVTAGAINGGGLNILAVGTGYAAASPLTLTALTGNGVTGVGFTVGAVSPSGTYSIAEILDGTYTPSTDPVTDGVTASVTFVGAYVDTKFGDCTFDSRDFYEKEPVQIVVSLLDETGDPCNDCGVATSTPGIMQQTSGETVLRDLLLTERYMQNPYHQGSFDGIRMNEIEGFDPLKLAVDRDSLYKVFYLQHSIPRLNNPTGVFDNDQYVYKFYVDCNDEVLLDEMFTLFDGLAAFCTSAYSNPITFEDEIDLLV